MKRYWKIVLVLFIVLLLAGILLGGTGLLTGASLKRISDALFSAQGGFRAALDRLYALLAAVF